MQPKKLLLFIWCLFLISTAQVFSQDKDDLKSIFVEAESYFLYEEYNEALGLYLQLYRLMPENANINYKLGRCYLHSDYKKELSIPYLEKASNNTTDNYRIKSFKEVQAPFEVFYFLGEAYRVTNQLDQAIEKYTFFLEKMDEEVYDRQLVEDQIEACKRAKKQMNNPVYFDARNLGSVINTNAKQSHAVLSGDGKKLAFVTKLPFYDAIFYTEKVGDNWKEPRNLTPEIKVDGGTFPTCMSFDGTEMYLYKLDGYNGNLYVTKLVNGRWTKPVELENINTKYWESHASISKDMRTLYFTSNRPGGQGDLDIYKSKRLSEFEWSEPENLGPTINSRYNDDTPFITADGKSLYFASLGHSTIGGYDIFVSDLENSEWTEPKNVGYPINTTSDELFFMPFENKISGFMPMIRKGGYGLYDIYEIEIYSELNPRRIKLNGKIQKIDNDIDFDKLLVEIFDKSSNKKLSESIVNTDGTFEIMGQSGNIEVKISGRGVDDYTTDLNLPIEYDEDSYAFEPQLEKTKLFAKKEEKADQQELPTLELEMDNVELAHGESLEIKFRTEKGVKIKIKAINDSRLYYEDSFTTKRRRSSITFKPETGDTKVILKVTDENGNSIEKSISVVVNGEEIEEQEDKVEVVSSSEEDASSTDLNIILKDLISLSEGELQATLNKYVAESQVKSLKNIVSQLYEDSMSGLFSAEDVDELLAKYANQLVENYNMKQVLDVSSAELSASLSQLSNDENITSTVELIDKYLSLSAEFDKENLLPILVNLSKEKTESFEALNKILNTIHTETNLLEIADGFNGTEFTDENLLSYFSEIIDGDDAAIVYKNILEKLLLENYIKAASEVVTGDLKSVLEKLLSDGHAISNSSEFVTSLFEKAKELGIDKDEVIKLLYELNKTIQQKEFAEEIVPEESLPEQEINNKKPYYWFAGGGLILIIWLILFLRRRKNK